MCWSTCSDGRLPRRSVLGWLGWSQLFVGIFAAMFLGGFGGALLTLLRIVERGRNPFGPHMLAGAALANLMFDLPAVTISVKDRLTPGHVLAETVATAGLVVVIFALARSNRAALIPAAVGTYIAAAYFFTSSTSFANPAITVGRMFSNTFAGIAPGAAPWFIAAQLVGGLAGYGAVNALYTHTTPARASA